ncbi:hypothetical protein RYX36_023393 [Vicia faba]
MNTNPTDTNLFNIYNCSSENLIPTPTLSYNNNNNLFLGDNRRLNIADMLSNSNIISHQETTILLRNFITLVMENQIWRELAQNNQATANDLRSKLEQINSKGGEERWSGRRGRRVLLRKRVAHGSVVHKRADAEQFNVEADARVRDLVYGCVGRVSELQMQLVVAQAEILCIQMQNEQVIIPNPEIN